MANTLVKPRLRFDKVATRLVGSVQAALRDEVTRGTTVAFTIAAPIRLPKQTGIALEALIREQLARRAKRIDVEQTINDNSVRVRVIRGDSAKAGKILGYVHNPDPGAAEVLLDAASS